MLLTQAAARRGGTPAEDDALQDAFDRFCAAEEAAPEPESTPAAAARSACGGGGLRCQIPGCGASLEALRPYNKRAKCGRASRSLGRRCPGCAGPVLTTRPLPRCTPGAAPQAVLGAPARGRVRAGGRRARPVLPGARARRRRRCCRPEPPGGFSLRKSRRRWEPLCTASAAHADAARRHPAALPPAAAAARL